MAEIGKYNKLRIIKNLHHGCYLDGENLGEILIPTRYVPENAEVDDEIEVFIYNDSEDRLIATTEKPYAQVGEFACLQVIEINPVGAFLDWGLPKHLLVPFREQKADMELGKKYVVYVYLDESSNRIAASGKPDKFLNKTTVEYTPGQQVEVIIFSQTDLGYRAIINNSHWGLIYKNEVFQELQRGDKLEVFIKKIYPDGKIDLSLQKGGYERIEKDAQFIYEALTSAGGFLPVNDNTAPEDIYELFEMSKKTFKKAIGALYREHMITIHDDGIRKSTED